MLELGDFVHPSTEAKTHDWKVTEIEGDRVTANRCEKSLTRDVYRISGPASMFEKISELEPEDED